MSGLAIVSIVISPAFAHDWDDDGWDDLDRAGKWGAEWDYGIDLEEDDFDWDDAECVVEDIDYSSVFEEREVELACGLE